MSVASAYTCFYLVPGQSLTRTTRLLARPREQERKKERGEEKESSRARLAMRNHLVRDIRSNWEIYARDERERERERERRWNKFSIRRVRVTERIDARAASRLICAY